MIAEKLINLAILTLIFTLGINGATFYLQQWMQETGVCTYTGYKPGGGIPDIQPITAPEASMAAKVVSHIAGLGSRSAILTMHSTKLMETFKKGGAKFLKIAPKLAPALGVFGAALGFVGALTSPTPQDILDEANKAIKELTDAVNDRLDKMKGYVEVRVIQMEKDLINREYRTLSNLFHNCIKEHTKQEVNRCMRDAEKLASATSPKFMILDSKMAAYNSVSHNRQYFEANTDKAPSYYDVKRLEAGIISFKDYANLHLLILSTLVNTYNATNDNSTNGMKYFKRYLNDQAIAAKKYTAYAHWAYKWILQRNVIENENGNFKQSCGAIQQEVGYELSSIPGFVDKVLELVHSTCKIDCTLMNIPSQCSYKVAVRCDGRRSLGGYFYKQIPVCANCFHAAVQTYSKTHGNTLCNAFLGRLKKDIETYYKGTLLSNSEIWNELAEQASAEYESISGDAAVENTALEDYSEEFINRHKRAVDLAIVQYKEMVNERKAKKSYDGRS